MVHHGDIGLRPHTKFEVSRPFRSEDVTHFRSQHYVGLVALVTLTFAFDLETGAHFRMPPSLRERRHIGAN